MNLIVGRAYYLEGMEEDMWSGGHPIYGKPRALAGLFLGTLKGTRTWYGFEIRMGGKEAGVIFMPEEDLKALRIRLITD